MKVASWNVNSLRVRLPHVLKWLQTAQPDLLALQETKVVDDQFPAAEIAAAGYQVIHAGQKTWNGVAILSKVEGRDIVTGLPGLDDPQRRVLGATYGDIRFLNLYVPNGQQVGSEKYRYKLDWLEKLLAYVKAQLEQYPRLVVAGDFNIAPEDRDVHDPAAWQGQILCSDPERAAFQHLLASGLADTFRLFEQEEGVFSWWDYRAAAFRRNIGARIDHILASTVLCEVCNYSTVDKEPRGWERPSDHAPVVSVFDGIRFA